MHGREDDAQRLGGPHLVLEFAAPLQMHAGRQFHLLGHHTLRFLDEADDVAVAADVQGDVVAQPAVFALDHGRALDDAHVGHFRERNLQWPTATACSGATRASPLLFRPAGVHRAPSAEKASTARCGRPLPRLTSNRLTDLFVLAEVAGVTDADREAVAALDRLRDDPAAQGDLDGVLDVVDADAVAGRLLRGRS